MSDDPNYDENGYSTRVGPPPPWWPEEEIYYPDVSTQNQLLAILIKQLKAAK